MDDWRLNGQEEYLFGVKLYKRKFESWCQVMKNKFYMIEILCKDTDNTIYNDNFRIGYRTFEKAKEVLDELINQEFEDLKSNGGDYYIQDYDESKEERYEREIHIETEDYEDMLTRYSIVVVEVEE